MTNRANSMNRILSANFARLRHPFAIGFDPSILDVHPFLAKQCQIASRFEFFIAWYQSVVDAIGKNSGCIKLQSAFFEAAGMEGAKALKQIIIDAKRRGLYVLLDAKRGDIASTMRAYGEAAFDDLGADALTILPWMGVDSIAALLPWMKKDHGVYTVWLSSNAGGRLIQTLQDRNEKTFAETVFETWEKWAQREEVLENSGFVLGATEIPSWTPRLLQARKQCLLMPGIGAQGGKITTELKNLITANPASLLPVSRGILSPTPDEAIASWQDYSDSVHHRWDQFIAQWHEV